MRARFPIFAFVSLAAAGCGSVTVAEPGGQGSTGCPGGVTCEKPPAGICGDAAPWAAAFGDAAPQATDVVALDEDCGVLVAGSFFGSIDAGGGPLVAGEDGAAFVAKLDRAGAHAWSRALPLRLGTAASAADGATILAGAAEAEVDLGGGPIPADLESSLLAKLDPAGAHVWSRRVDGFVISIAAAPDGGVFAIDSSGTLRKLDAKGGETFSVKLDGFVHPTVEPRSVDVDASGHAIVGGVSAKHFPCEPENVPDCYQPPSLYDSFVARVDSHGAIEWRWQPEDADDHFLVSTAVSPSGDVLVAYDEAGGDSFRTRALVLDSKGAPRWSKSFDVYVPALAIDETGASFFFDELRTPVDLGGGPIAPIGHGVYVTMLSPSGEHVATHGFDATFASPSGSIPGLDRQRKIAAAGGQAFLAGQFRGAIDLGTGVLAGAGESDAFVARVALPAGVSSSGRAAPVCGAGAPVDPAAATATVEAGSSHTCALLGSGVVQCWGTDEYGALGDGAPSYDPKPPHATQPMPGAIGIATGFRLSCAVHADHTMSCWGDNYAGLLGEALPQSALASPTCTGVSGVARVSLGGASVCTLLDGGRAGCRVDNLFPSDANAVAALSDVVQVDTYGRQACAVHGDGTLSCWGENYGGAVGDGTKEARPQPVKVGLSDVVEVSLGFDFTCARRASGTVSCWGQNDRGQLGDGTMAERALPQEIDGLSGALQIEAGYDFACARLTGGTVRCWGSNYSGQLGVGTGSTERLAPTEVKGLGGVVHLSCGSGHACAIGKGGAIHCWGDNAYGQLGSPGDSAFTPIPVTLAP